MNPPRSNTTLSMPAALARSAISWPMRVAARRSSRCRRPLIGFGRRRRGERAAGVVVDDLGHDVLVGTEDARRGRVAVPWTFLRTRR
jgi:hypothetical protein